MSEPILCHKCEHDIDRHDHIHDYGCVEERCLCHFKPSDIAREYKEGYGRWKEAGRGYHRVLLSIWRALTPDSEHTTFGDDPEAVFEALEDAWAAEPTEAEMEAGAEALFEWDILPTHPGPKPRWSTATELTKDMWRVAARSALKAARGA